MAETQIGLCVSENIRLAPNPANKCFGCGGANDDGMRLTFEQDNENRRIVGRFVLGERYQGGGGMAARRDHRARCWMKRWEKFAVFAKLWR